ncbi:MAG: tetratricopeptide repeat protein [Bacteroidota bacterium]
MKRVLTIIIFIILASSSLMARGQDPDSLFLKLKKSANADDSLKNLTRIANYYNNFYDLENVLKYATPAVEIAKRNEKYFSAGINLNYIGQAYYAASINEEAISYYLLAAESYEKCDSVSYAMDCYVYAGYLNSVTGDFQKGIEILLSALEKADAMKLNMHIPRLYMALGFIHRGMKDYERALDYFLKSNELAEQNRDTAYICTALNEIGNIYNLTEDYENALDYHLRSLQLKEKSGAGPRAMSYSYNDIANDYYALDIFPKALEYFFRSYKIDKELNDVFGLSASALNIGNLYIVTEQYDKAFPYLQEARYYGEIMKSGTILELVYSNLSNYYARVGNYGKALEYKKMYSNMHDSIFTEDMTRQVNEIQKKFDTEKRQKEIEILNKDKKLRELTIQKQARETARQQIIIYVALTGLVLILALSFILFRVSYLKKRANRLLSELNARISQQKEEIQSQRDEIESQRDKIAAQRDLAASQRDQIIIQKKEITDSIQYGRRIQQAVSPPAGMLDSFFSEHFILNLPQDIVSGDFFWFARSGEKAVIAVADCTGKGIPGALMSLLGTAYLNDIVSRGSLDSAAGILNGLRNEILSSLFRIGDTEFSADVMDISLCVIDRAVEKAVFSGANQNIYVVSDGSLSEHKGNNFSIGAYFNRNVDICTDQQFPLRQGDLLYMFTDGFADQFGGKHARKLKYNAFREFLISISGQPLAEQKEKLQAYYSEWKGGLPQVDDILVAGMKI